jgi:N-acetylated-alpha-linked acidic dipeptidase
LPQHNVRTGLGRTILATVVALTVSPAPAVENATLDGYTSQTSGAERAWESKFRALPSPDKQRQYMQRLAAHPHHVGSPYDKDNAEWLLAQFKHWGFDAHIENFDVLFPTPKQLKLELLEPRRFEAKLKEPPVAVDPTSSQSGEQLPPYNAYSIDGDVTGPLVYVNYGMPDDYETLARYGVSVQGAIVIARYGHGWRGVKPKVAAQHGAIGCIIYSDPRDDGYGEGDVYPEGGWRPREGVQRGSVMDTDYPGDPLTPGIASVPGAKRLRIEEAKTITKIPVLPISYGDAQPLLEELRGRVAPEEWRGGLPVTYHLGPGPAKVHLVVQSNWDQKRLYDVIAIMRGAELPGEWVLRGNHHDAWVNGAEDPISGLVTLLEEARAFGELAKQGWKPKRTVVFCAWDGEEPGLLGSTEWVEAHEEDLLRHAVAYFNSDTNDRGYWYASGSHVLEKFLNAVAREITDPEKQISVWERKKLSEIEHAATEEKRDEIRNRADLRIGALGDGSDYASFIDHLGIASVNVEFGGEVDGDAYHSIYDDYYWYSHFGDPKFDYERTESQFMGTAVMRLADADLLPFDFTNFSETVQMYLRNVQKVVKTEQDNVRERRRQMQEGVYRATSDPEQPLLPPLMAEMPPYMNFAPLENAVAALARSAERYASAIAKVKAKGGELPNAVMARVNQLLMQSGPALTDAGGLPGRPWFKNQIYAPGAYTGYEAKPLPGVLEAMDRKNWAEAESQVPREAAAIEREIKIIDAASAAIEAAVK